MKLKLRACGIALPAIIVINLAALAVTHAQTTTWTNNSGGLFSNAANWNNGSPNGPTFNAIIDDGDSAVSVTLDVSRTINDLTMGPDDALLFNDNATLTVGGNVNNNGLIQLNSVGNVTALNISGAGNHDLSGSGILRLGSGVTRIGGSGTLVNTATHTIEAGGNVGVNSIGINNLGLIRANVFGTTMTIDPSAAGGLINTGTMRAENGGALLLTGSGGGAFDNTGGTISALAGSQVRLAGSLSITGGTLSTVGNGSISVDGSQTVFLTGLTNAGSLVVNDNSLLRLSGSIVNTGSISTNSVGNVTNLSIESGGVTLSGGGTANFQNDLAGISGGSTGARLTNVNNTIRGFGRIGQNGAAITNQASGIIQADVNARSLVLDPVTSATDGDVSFINNGILRASNGGTLVMTGSGGGSFRNNNIIEALDLSTVLLTTSASVTGGTFSTAGTGRIRVGGSQTVFLSNLTNAGSLVVDDNSLLRLSGSIVNTGSISTNSVGNVTNLGVEIGGLALSGGGSLIFQNNLAGISGVSSGERLTNVDNIIGGYGRIGQNTAAITNQASGIIQADVNARSLVLDPVATAADGNPSFINNGILRASNSGILLLTGSGGGTFQNNNRIEALDLSTVLLQTNASVTGGTLATSGSGAVVVDNGQNVFFTGITNTGTLIAKDNSDLGISGSIVNTSAIRLQSVGNQTDLEIQSGGATLSGGGNVFLEIQTTGINSDVTGTRFINTDNTIQGIGSIGQNNTAITNSLGGIIEATAGGTLTLNPVAESGVIDLGASFVNDGILRASGGGKLLLTGSGGGDFTNNNRIEALDGSEVQLNLDASVTGGTLATSGTGIIRVLNGQNVFFKDLTFAGNVVSNDNSDFGISGAITNTGSISLTSVGNQTDLEIQADGATLDGGGTVTFANPTTGLNSAVSGTRFTNTDNVLQGQGAIGQNNTAITNAAEGLINANVSGGRITLDPVAGALDAGPSFQNDGILRASDGGILRFTGSGGGTFTNSHLIEALAGSIVELSSGASITGGTLSTSGDGIIRVLNSQNAFLTDLGNEGNLVSEDNSDLGISGTIGNSGSITLNSVGNQTDLEIQASGATLTSGGTVSLTTSTVGINTSSTGSRLTNSDNTIRGRGSFGRNTLAITNGSDATIDANILGTTLTIDPVATATDGDPSFLNQGVVQASNGGTLTLTGSGGGTFTNATSGSFQALNGSTLNMVTGAALTNNVAGVLTGGRYVSVDSGNGASLTLLGTPVTTIAANTVVDLSGANSAITFNGTALSQTLTGNAGTLRLRDGRVFNNTNALANSGTLDLRGGTFSAPALANSGSITGFGNLNVRPSNSGSIVADGGSLVLSNGIAATGTTSSVTVNAGAALDLSPGAGASSAAILSHNGTDLNLGGKSFTVTSDYTNANSGTGNAFNARANVSGSGLILASGDTTQTITGAAAGGTLDFGNVHVGDNNTLNYRIANTGTTGPALRGAIQTAANGGNVTDSRISGAGATAGNFGPIATGADSGDLGVTFNATSAGALSGQIIHVENNFDNVAGSDIAITGAAYRLAAPSVSPNSVNFGIIHVGDTVSQNLTLANTAPADGFSESLNAAFSFASADVIAGGTVSGLTAGASDSSSLSVSVDTSSAKIINGNSILAFASNGDGSSGLGLTDLTGAEIAVTAQVNNFAAPGFILQSGAATLTQDDAMSFTLDFGTLDQNSASPTASLAIANDVLGPADSLAAVFDLINSSDFTTSGFTGFSGLEAGNSQSGFTVLLDTSSTGDFSGSIFVDARSQNSSGFDGSLGRFTIALRGSVAVPEPSSSALVLLGLSAALLRRKRSGGVSAI